MKLDNEDLEIINLIGENENFKFKKFNNFGFYEFCLMNLFITFFGVALYLKTNSILGSTLFFLLIFLASISFFKLNKKENLNNPILEKKHNKIIKMLFKNIKKEKETLIALKMLNNDLNNLRLRKIKKDDLKKEKSLTLKKYRKLLKDKIAYNKKLMKY